MSAIDYATVKALNELYERRQRLQRSREECRKEEWWYDALERVGNGTGARSSVIESLGGQKSFAALVLHAAQSRFESMQADIDKQIADLGGRAALSGDRPKEGSVMRQEWLEGMSVRVEHDGFAGTIIGHYVTREGKRGVVVQQHETRVVHVYGERWLIREDRDV